MSKPMTAQTITRVNCYRDEEGMWAYAAWTADEFDHSDGMGAVAGLPLVVVRGVLAQMFPGAIITLVEAN